MYIYIHTYINIYIYTHTHSTYVVRNLSTVQKHRTRKSRNRAPAKVTGWKRNLLIIKYFSINKYTRTGRSLPRWISYPDVLNKQKFWLSNHHKIYADDSCQCIDNFSCLHFLLVFPLESRWPTMLMSCYPLPSLHSLAPLTERVKTLRSLIQRWHLQIFQCSVADPDPEISLPNPDPAPALVICKKISVSVQYRAYVYLFTL